MRISIPVVTLNVRGRSFNGYQICGGAGILSGLVTAAVLTRALELSFPFIVAATFAGLAVLFLLTIASKVLVGRVVLVNYHHLIGVTLVAALVMRAAASAALLHLAAFVAALMVFQAVARMGCLMVGCCHGQPQEWGLCYGADHVADGFAPHLVDVPLAPVQAIEAAWALLIGVLASSALLTGAPPGVVLASSITAYAAGRFVTSHWRASQAGRIAGFSQVQWTSVVLILAVAIGSLATAPASAVGWIAAGLLLSVAGYRGIRRTVPDRDRQFFDADHVLELAGALSIICDLEGDANLHVATTSAGVTLSRGTIWYSDLVTHHYTMSLLSGELTEDRAQRLAKLISLLRHRGVRGALQRGQLAGCFHLLIPCTTAALPALNQLPAWMAHDPYRLSAPLPVALP